MKFTSKAAVTNSMTLDQVANRLSERPEIDGIFYMGSTASGELKPNSDYDIVVVFQELLVPIHILTTWIHGHFAEIHCTTTESIERVIAQPLEWSSGSEEEAIIRWLRSGRIAFDRHGTLRHAQDIASQTPKAVPSSTAIASGWWGISYNVSHLNRYLADADPMAETVVRIRLLYSVFQVVAGYFIVRGIAWSGEKSAVEHLTLHDPNYLQVLQQCLAEEELSQKAGLYRQLADLTLAPVGGLSREGNTAIWIGNGFGSGVGESPTGSVDETVQAAARYWEQLFLDEE
jgi:hypothetical protein